MEETLNNRIKTKIRRGKIYPLGFSRQDEWMQFTAIFPGQQEVKLQLWEKGEKITEIKLNGAYQIGDLYSVQIPATKKKVYYTYEVGGKQIADPCAKKLFTWRDTEKKVLLSTEIDEFDWEQEKRPELLFKEMIIYRLHIRGFTKHSASNVKHKGTFAGLCEKIPYLKELGINTILLMPCYEFEDYYMIPAADPRFSKKKGTIVKNYWGYGGACWYFAPKQCFSANKKSPETEFRSMIKEMHKNNIEVLMEFSFNSNINPYFIIDCFRYWAEEYHIDGFYINDGVTMIDMIAKDPVLADRKLLARYWDQTRIFGKKERFDLDDSKNALENQNDQRCLADYHDRFLKTARCFLKGDGGQTREFASVFRENSEHVAQINYITDNNGFTLADLVSYNEKHNEENGEDGYDGTKENYSWNCGQEGKTKKRMVLRLRERQMKNAMVMLFFSQGVPMLYAGDEFGNSQNGNNNAYCQDNKIGWVSWDQKARNEVFFEFVKKLIVIRKQMAVFQNAHRLYGQDYLACGSPDISWHGIKAWYPDFTAESRLLGVLLSGRYARGKDNRSIYIVFNMNWEDASIGFPRPDRGQCWKLLMDTAKTEAFVQERQNKEEKKEYYMKARSIAVFVSATTIDTMDRTSNLSYKHDKEQKAASKEIAEQPRKK